MSQTDLQPPSLSEMVISSIPAPLLFDWDTNLLDHKAQSYLELSDIENLASSLIYGSTNIEINEVGTEKVDENDLVNRARFCIENNMSVELCPEGVGGAYFIYDENAVPVAVFKPQDEEPGAVNNPKGTHEGLLPPGEGYKREIAAWLLDHKNHARVPETHFLKDVTHERFNNLSGLKKKSGSLQKYVPNIGDAESISSSRFLVSDVHSIGILDLRIFNMDRNLENFLVISESSQVCRIVPIDHTFSLPPTLDSASFDWLYWKQTKVPFSSESLRYIEDIDVERDGNILRSIGIEQDSIRTMKISSLWLKWGAAAGLTLHEIACVVCRRKPTERSFLETMVMEAEALTPVGMDSELFYHTLRKVMAKHYGFQSPHLDKKLLRRLQENQNEIHLE